MKVFSEIRLVQQCSLFGLWIRFFIASGSFQSPSAWRHLKRQPFFSCLWLVFCWFTIRLTRQCSLFGRIGWDLIKFLKEILISLPTDFCLSKIYVPSFSLDKLQCEDKKRQPYLWLSLFRLFIDLQSDSLENAHYSFAFSALPG